jgi:hypothetical protein
MKPARVELAAPGSITTYVVRAPFATMPESTRAPRIEEREKIFADELRALEDGTIKRNREFYRLLEQIEVRNRSWETKLKEEEASQSALHKELCSTFESMMSSTIFTEMKMLVADVERFHQEKIPPQVGGSYLNKIKELTRGSQIVLRCVLGKASNFSRKHAHDF